MKYNTTNTLETISKMRKKEPHLIKKEKFLYDLQLAELIPHDIQNTAKEKIIEQTLSGISDFSFFIIDGNKYSYSLRCDIQRYNVFNNDKLSYKIMELTGITLCSYAYNIFGRVDANERPILAEEFGEKRNGYCYIPSIEIYH